MKPIDIVKFMTSSLKHIAIDVKEVQVKGIAFKHSRPKDCFNNSYRFMNSDSNQTYVLGYFMMNIGGSFVPIEHAWVNDGGVMVDPTNLNVGESVYIQVTEITYEELNQFVLKHGFSPDIYTLNRFIGEIKKN